MTLLAAAAAASAATTTTTTTHESDAAVSCLIKYFALALLCLLINRVLTTSVHQSIVSVSACQQASTVDRKIELQCHYHQRARLTGVSLAFEEQYCCEF